MRIQPARVSILNCWGIYSPISNRLDLKADHMIYSLQALLVLVQGQSGPNMANAKGKLSHAKLYLPSLRGSQTLCSDELNSRLMTEIGKTYIVICNLQGWLKYVNLDSSDHHREGECMTILKALIPNWNSSTRSSGAATFSPFSPLQTKLMGNGTLFPEFSKANFGITCQQMQR